MPVERIGFSPRVRFATSIAVLAASICASSAPAAGQGKPGIAQEVQSTLRKKSPMPKMHVRSARARSATRVIAGSRHRKPNPVAGKIDSAATRSGDDVVNNRANGATTTASGETMDQSQAPSAATMVRPKPRASDEELMEIARTYCGNMTAGAAEARVARQRRQLQDLEKEVVDKSASLAKLSQEARGWVEKREQLWTSARDSLVETYAKMKPEAAAQQLAAMSEETASAIIMKLNARAASAILNEMGSDRAARLADGALKRMDAGSRLGKSGS